MREENLFLDELPVNDSLISEERQFQSLNNLDTNFAQSTPFLHLSLNDRLIPISMI